MTIHRIALAGEIYSANVGDRAIHDCLTYVFKQLNPALQVLSIDLSGRSGSGSQRTAGFKQSITRRIAPGGARLPLALMNLGAQLGRRLSGQSARWRQSLQNADLLVIGGGQLLMDDALNFPLKIHSLASAAVAADIPLHFCACGVGADWSMLGGNLLRAALRNARTISLRDQLSQQRLSRLFPNLQSQVTCDPAVWAAEVYALPMGARGGSLGLGVISREEANQRLARGDRVSAADWNRLWLDLVRELAALGHPMELFTTGNPADQAFAEQLLEESKQQDLHQVNLAPLPTSPRESLVTLSGYSLVVAARLHAAILANAIGIPTVGLGWDAKVRAYYQESGRVDQCFELTQLNVFQVRQVCASLWGDSFPSEQLQEMKQRALENARLILETGSENLETGG